MEQQSIDRLSSPTWAWLEAGCPSPLVVNVRDGSVLVYVPAGAFEIGSAAGEGVDDERPRHRVELSAYWIGVYAVSNAQYLRFVEATGHRVPDQSDWSASTAIWQGKSFPAAKAEHPVVCVSWDTAREYAQWAGCGLASEAQWEKACRGPLGLEYPWGKDWDATRCRHDKNKGNETTCRVYDYAKGASGYGTYNQSGNVWEWCGDWYDGSYHRQSPAKDPRGPAGGSLRVSRGGCWGLVVPGLFRAALRSGSVPGFRLDLLGFRLVRAAS